MADINPRVNQVQNAEEETNSLSLKEIWGIVINNWYWILLSLIVCVGLAFAYLRYTRPVYSTAMKVLIKDDQNSQRRPSANALDQLGMGMMLGSNGFDNELEILTSTDIATEVVRKLKLYTSYSYEGRVRAKELYGNSPLIVDMAKADLDTLETTVKMKITRRKHGIKVEGEYFVIGEKDPRTFRGEVNAFPGSIKSPVGTITFERNPQFRLRNATLLATIMPVQAMGAHYAKVTSVAPTSKTTTVAAISLNDTQPKRAIDFLNGLIERYNEEANEDKNEVGKKTNEFIKSRIEVIRAELDSTEKKLERYKQENELVNLPNDATMSLTGSADYEKQEVEKETELNIAQMLLDYMNNPSNASNVIPANLGIQDQNLDKQIAAYNVNIQTLNRLLRTEGNELNPIVTKLNAEVEIAWDQIRSSVQRIVDGISIAKDAIVRQHEIYTNKVTRKPVEERMLNNLTRQQQVKSELYLLLLQKQEENQIALASVASKARVIDSPKKLGMVAPKAQMILLMGAAAGVVLPIAFFWLLNLMRTRIESREDVEKLTNIPILAEIPVAKNLKKGQRAIVVRENTNDSMEESFRGLRTNLRFILTGDEKVILTTSVLPGEGKTFVSTNLSMSLALLGKRVLIIGLDIRKPQLVKLFGMHDDQRGISTYLAGETADFDLLLDQIKHGVVSENLDILPAGIIPPNPAELISKDLLDKAIEFLRTQYDYIVLDTPPVGLVSDTIELGRLADASFFVGRANYSYKDNFKFINAIKEDDKLPKINIVLNGVEYSKRGYGKYGRYGRYGRYGTYGKYGQTK